MNLIIKLILITVLSCMIFLSGCEGTGAGDNTDDGLNEGTKPVISDFTLPGGSTTANGTLTVSITDDGTATAWLITLSATAPASDSADWLSAKPTEYILPASGTYSLYAWAKNSDGLISDGKGPVSAVYSTGGPAPAIYFSEYVEGGILDAGEVWVIVDDRADTGLKDHADQEQSFSFNGDDAIALVYNGTTVNIIGQIGIDPGSEWGTGDSSTSNNVIRRKFSVTAGDTNGSDAFDPSLEWDGFYQDDFSDLGSYEIP